MEYNTLPSRGPRRHNQRQVACGQSQRAPRVLRSRASSNRHDPARRRRHRLLPVAPRIQRRRRLGAARVLEGQAPRGEKAGKQRRGPLGRVHSGAEIQHRGGHVLGVHERAEEGGPAALRGRPAARHLGQIEHRLRRVEPGRLRRGGFRRVAGGAAPRRDMGRGEGRVARILCNGGGGGEVQQGGGAAQHVQDQQEGSPWPTHQTVRD